MKRKLSLTPSRVQPRPGQAPTIPPLALACAIALLPACQKERAMPPAPRETASAVGTATLPVRSQTQLDKSGGKTQAATSAGESLSSVLMKLRRARATAFREPAPHEAKAYREALVGALSSWQSSAAQRGSLPEVSGFEWRELEAAKLLVFAERETNTGAGAVVIRGEPRAAVVIQAPHTFFDSGTLPIALHLFESLQGAALMINTLHRAHGVADEERAARARAGKETTDVAHNPMTYYQAAHEACLQALPRATVVQIHGFRSGHQASVVVSAAGSGGPARDVAHALNQAFDEPVARLFPDEVRVLGGMSNVQAGASREKDAAFIHLELSSRFRKLLDDDPSAKQRFAAALAKGLGIAEEE